jgi:hypothetical protein
VRIPAAGQSRTAILTGSEVTDARGAILVQFADMPTSGNGVSTAVQLRRSGSNYYQATIRLAPGGVATRVRNRRHLDGDAVGACVARVVRSARLATHESR